MKKKEILIPEQECKECPFHQHEVHHYWRCCLYMTLREAHPIMGFIRPKWCKARKVTIEEDD